MPLRGSFQLPDGRTWNVESDEPNAFIIIPINQLDNLSSEQIGKYVQLLIKPARMCLAKEIVYIVDDLCEPGQTIPIEFCNEWIDLLEEFKHSSEEISNALLILLKTKETLIQKEQEERRLAELKKAPNPKRKEIKLSYDKLFVTLGRRDGFSCLMCGSSAKDLQIDHVIPISHNGTNDISNLQLLCPSCNSRKKDKILNI